MERSAVGPTGLGDRARLRSATRAGRWAAPHARTAWLGRRCGRSRARHPHRRHRRHLCGSLRGRCGRAPLRHAAPGHRSAVWTCPQGRPPLRVCGRSARLRVLFRRLRSVFVHHRSGVSDGRALVCCSRGVSTRLRRLFSAGFIRRLGAPSGGTLCIPIMASARTLWAAGFQRLALAPPPRVSVLSAFL